MSENKCLLILLNQFVCSIKITRVWKISTKFCFNNKKHNVWRAISTIVVCSNVVKWLTFALVTAKNVDCNETEKTKISAILQSLITFFFMD